MAVEQKPIYGFIAGEVSPSFFGRTDLSKYELGVMLAQNFYIDYRGGMVSRPGFAFCAPIEDDHLDVKMFRFRATDDDYVLLFGHNYIRPMRNGGYLLEAAKTITGIAGNVFTSAAHGYAVGDMIYLSGIVGATQFNGRYVEVSAATANTFTITLVNGFALDSSGYSAYVSGGSAFRTVRVTTTYASTDLAGLSLEQKYNDITITSLDFDPARLTYVSDTSWTLSTISFGGTVAAPTVPTLTPSGAAAAGVAFAVTAIIGGKESVASPYAMTSLTVNYSTTAGSMLITWPGVANAEEYNVYRSLILPTGAQISRAQELGYIGRTFGPQFIDTNIVPDFTKTPPVYYNPFADGAVEYITVTGAGAGYTAASAVSLSGGGGSGFVGYCVVNSAGALLAIVIVNGGSGYTSAPTVNVTVGAGATFSVSLGATTGNNPRIFKNFQQRGVYAGTVNSPMSLYGSRPGDVDNFDVSSVVNAGDGYTFTIDAIEVKPINHLVALRAGLLIFTSNAINLLRAEEGKAVSAVNALSEPQAYKGASSCPPITIDLDVLFVQDRSTALNAMQYTEYTNTFQLQDVSILSNHLIGKGKNIQRMGWQAEPNKLLWSLREDGALLSLTYERAQEVFAWAQHYTRGLFKDCVVVHEEVAERLYAVVERKVQGRWQKFVEVMMPREVATEDHWGVDCGLGYSHEYPAASLTPSATTGTAITFTASAAVFSAGDVGKIIYVGGGKAEIVGYVGATQVTCDFLRSMSVVMPEVWDTPISLTYLADDWSMAAPVSTLSGLWHLEGETVSVLADGDAYLDAVVASGSITLDVPASKITVGLPFRARGKTLPLTLSSALIEGHRKDIIGVAARLKETRGLSFGDDFSRMVEMKDRTDVDWGASLEDRNGSAYASVSSAWDEEGVVCFEQLYPLPATILGLVVDAVIGDD